MPGRVFKTRRFGGEQELEAFHHTAVPNNGPFPGSSPLERNWSADHLSLQI